MVDYGSLNDAPEGFACFEFSLLIFLMRFFRMNIYCNLKLLLMLPENLKQRMQLLGIKYRNDLSHLIIDLLSYQLQLSNLIRGGQCSQAILLAQLKVKKV